jgi:adenosylhomocysteine nucleosidase
MTVGKIGAVISIFVMLLCSSCGSVLRGTKPEPVTGILGAFRQEIAILEDKLADRQARRIEGMEFVSGKLNGKRVVMAWTGTGTVNAAMTTTLLIEHFRPNEVIFTGVAGGTNPQLQPGDIVIAQKIAYHDSGVLTPEEFVYKSVRNPLDGIENPFFFPADERLLGLAEEAAGRVELGTLKTSEGERTPKIVKGVIVTGDVFVASPAKCAELREKFKADAVEMEGAAVAQVCFQQGVGHIVIRCISDRADESAVSDLAAFYVMAAQNSASLVAEMVALMASQVGQPVNAKVENQK